MHLCVVCRRAGKDLRVARPPKALVPLRAVCRHVQKIAQLCPVNALIQLIDVLVRACKISCPLVFCAEHQPCDLLRRQSLVHTRNLHIAKTAAHQLGCIRLLPGAAHHIVVGILRRIQILRPNRPHRIITAGHSAVVERLRVPYCDSLPPLSLGIPKDKLAVSIKVLSKVIDIHPRNRLGHCNRLARLYAAHRRHPAGSLFQRVILQKNVRLLPAVRRKSALTPARLLACGIIKFSQKHIIILNRSVCISLPRIVCDNTLCAVIVVLQHKLCL